jgi:hypothetical protein
MEPNQSPLHVGQVVHTPAGPGHVAELSPEGVRVLVGPRKVSILYWLGQVYPHAMGGYVID